ncbi:hypothetical protein PV325_008322 [Microctonus aethiopoides]|nr:hypothetical protein PV325_008322 [Microctonus aethiopoides]KAK0097371.1 hypothetical protein PV326_002236 [Microctonus aethiopoides]
MWNFNRLIQIVFTLAIIAGDLLINNVGVFVSCEAHELIQQENSNHRARSLPRVDEIPIEQPKWNTLAEHLDVYSTKNLAKNWNKDVIPLVKSQCAHDITRFIEGLKKQEIWALKADDASGRFTNGFFWGNSYFVGSATECAYIGHDYTRSIFDQTQWNSTFSSLNTQDGNSLGGSKIIINSGPSGSNNLPITIPDTPPYKLGFFMMTVSINSSILTPITRSIHLGLCLPFSCTANDVYVIGKLAASDSTKNYSFIEKVRDQHNYYNIFEDNVFWALLGSSTVVLILMIAGTAYDYYLTIKVKRQMKSNVYDIERRTKLDRAINVSNFNQRQTLSNDATATIPITVGNIIADDIHNNDSNNNSSRKNNDCAMMSDSSEISMNIQELIRENMKTICDPSVGRDTISTVHGLRAISMAWVILGHTCIVIFKYSDNMEYRKVVEKKFLFQTITNGAFSVDTFFFMGGLLVAYLFFRTNAMGDLKKLTQGTRGFVSGFLKFMGLIIYRFCRLTTPYMFILGVVEVTMKWFNANSVFEPPTADHENCPNYWWRNLLYINTLFPVDQMCMLWSWYVADDTQFYVIGAVILVIATNHFKVAAFSVTILLISSWFTTGYIALMNNHMPSLDDPLALFDKIYDKPWTRLGPYLIGMSTTVVIGWLLSSACLLSLLYGLYEAELSPMTAAAYSSLSHSAWALGLSWIVVACSTGYGGWVNSILSAPILYPFSRVTYCAYLVHPIIIRLTAMNLDSPFHLGKDTVVIVFFGQVVLSYLVSFVISLAFEAPVVSMLKILAPKKKKRIQ